MFTVGQKDVPFLESALNDSIPVRYLAPVRYVPGAVTGNVEGIIKGNPDKEILVMAHADTQYNTPGANDNTAAVIVMLMLAYGLAAEKQGSRVTFLAAGAGEYGSLGATHYCEWRRRQGTLNRILCCVNLDSLTCGPDLLLDSPDEALKKITADAYREAGAGGECKFYSNTPGADDKPFADAGIRTISLRAENNDATLNLRHTPHDREERVNPRLAENAYRTLLMTLRRLRVLELS